MSYDPATFAMTFTHHTASVNGVRLHYVIGGTGDLVVLLHGWPQTWYEWRQIMPALAEHYTVMAPDLRGCGDSEKPLTGYNKRTVAEDIYQLVRQLGRDRIFLVGHDIGSMVAYAYAAAHPETVHRLVVSEFLLPGFGLEEAMDVARGGYWHFGFHMTPDIPEALVTGKERFYLTLFYQGLAYNPAALVEADSDEYVRCYSAPGGLRGGFSHYQTLLEDGLQNKESAKTKLTMPVLTLGGDSSMQDQVYKSMQPVASDVRGFVVERCGHFIAEEHPQALVEQILIFFREQ